jgi:uncharacterized protein with HEPN domain
MSGNGGDIARLLHIQDALWSIQSYLGNSTQDEFLASPMMRDAVVRQCEVIGEASRYISDGLKQRFPDVEWQELTDFRNVLIHQYFGVNFKIVWQATQSTFPALLQNIQHILHELTGE